MTNNMSGVCEGGEEQMNNSYERREHRAHRTGRLGSANRGGLLLFKLDDDDGNRGVSRLIPLCTDK